jgi:uncharacterized protein DUF4349
MRRLDETPIDPEVAASLEAIDATLAGEPVDPRHAELAELALLLAAEHPRPSPDFAGSLDDAVGRRFAAAPTAGRSKPARRRRWWLWSPAAGVAVALTVAVVIVVAGGSGGHQSVSPLAAAPSAKVPAAASAHRAAPIRSGSIPSLALGKTASSSSSASAGSSPAAGSAAAAASSPAAPALLQPPPNGRKIIQSAQLALSTAPSRIDTVGEELFVVVGQVGGIVNSSTVAAGGPGGYAQFQLSIPSASLSQTMAGLSSLHYARVVSRTDTTQDVNDQYQADVRQLADARALRTSLLRQLANATTQAQIASLTAQIHDAEASISSDEATLRALNHQINYTQVTVTINGGLVPVPVQSTGSGGGFSLGQAAHDAGRVLTVAAGVALIAGAALVPVALLGALVWWVVAAVRRRRREQALDLV